MRHAILLAAFFLLCGCGARHALSEQDAARSYTITHDKTQRQAYNAAEVWISETFVSAKAVIDVRQPDSGLLIGKTYVDLRQVVALAGRTARYEVVLKITNLDKSTTVRGLIRPEWGDSIMGEDNELAELVGKVDGFANDLASHLGGTVTVRPRALATAVISEPAEAPPASTPLPQ